MLAVRWHRQHLPDEVRRQLELADRERILAFVDDGSGRQVVASETALHLQRNPPAYSRFSWDQIEHVRYGDGVMTITLVPEVDGAILRVPMGTDRDLPVVVRDRVTASVVVDRFTPLVGDHGVRIIGRRGDRGTVTWRTDLDAELLEDGAAHEESRRLLAQVQSEVMTN